MALGLVVAADAPAATGDLTFAQCFDDDDTNLEGTKCPASPGLDAVSSVAVSADGKSLYAASFNNDAIVRFNRNTTTGALTFAQCIEGGDLEGATCPDVLPLDGADAVAVSGDGRSVYVASFDADAILRFNRNTTTGAISFAQCFQDKSDAPSDVAECDDRGGLNAATSVTVSADGRSVYAAGLSDDAIVRFNRNATTGVLTFAECFDDEDTGPEAACPPAPGLDAATSVEVSRDGRSLYAAGSEDDAIVRFNRNTTTGEIGFAQCFQDKADALADETACADRVGLNGANSVAVSGDGKSLYATSFFDAAIVRFSRNTTTGALTFAECFDDEDTNLEGARCLGAPALDAPVSVAVSVDGRSLYAAALDDDAVTRFNRESLAGPPGDSLPSNEFSFGKVKRNKRKGTAKLTIEIAEGPGELELAKTKKVKADDEAVEADGAAEDKLKIKPKGKARKRLGKKGKAKVKAEVTYTPDGGQPNTASKRIRLIKR